MKTEDIIDSKIGSRQVVAMYFGGVLRWPTSGALTYVITGAQLHFSRGSALDAGEVNSDYSGNYAWVTGTVVPYRGDEPQTPLSDVMLVPTVTNTTDFVVRNTYYIYGHNLGTTPTYATKETSVDVTYKTSDDFRVGSTVTQTRNIETVTDGTPYIVDGTPYETVDPVPNTYRVVLNLSQYGNRMYLCPAYGNPSVSLVCYGGHDEATFSHTPWQEFTPRIHSFSSGSSYTINEETDYGEYPPVQVGQSEGVNDDLSENIELTFSVSGGSGWASYNYIQDILTIDNAGKTVYQLPRSVTITATNGNATESVTAYQQANILESTTVAYDIYCAFQRAQDFPASGGSYAVDYRSFATTTETYTSGDYSVLAPVYSDVGLVGCTSLVDEVSGSGTFNISLGANSGGTKYVSVTLTAQDDISKSSSDWRYQEGAPVVAGILYPTVNQLTGVVSMKWEWNTASVAPTYPLSVDIDTLVYHWVLDGETTEYTQGVMGTTTVSFSANKGTFSLNRKITPHLEGTSGRSWFTASSVTGVYFDAGNQSETFPTDKTFRVREPSPIEPLE